MTVPFNAQFDDQRLFISHETWVDLTMSTNTFALSAVFTTFREIVSRNGAVKILMADESSILRSLDRPSDIAALTAEVNENRIKAGLEQFESF